MINIFIILLLVYAFYRGYRRGLAAQATRLVGYIITFVLSSKLSSVLSKYISILIPFPALQEGTNLAIYDENMSFFLDKAFYNAISFMLISFIGWIVTNLVAHLFRDVAKNKILKYVNSIAGGVINIGVFYVGVFLVLFVLSLVPIESIQQMFVDNRLAYWVVSQTPFLSDYIGKVWFSVNPF